MALLTVDEYIERKYAPKSRPPKTTVWRWIRLGKIPARKEGRRYYIDEQALKLTGNKIVDNVLCQ
jgi:hypothetical protein